MIPSKFIPGINRLPQSAVNSRMCHAYSMTGHLNGMNAVLATTLHVKTLLQRISPAPQELCQPASVRVEKSIEDVFPQSTETLTTLQPIGEVVYGVSCVISLASVGTPVCDQPEYIRLTFQRTKNGALLSPLL